ncbi:hypothetical protein TUM4445_22350 [Shewanella sp. MBTL60-112-B2]|nr:hypothetical protein TUM4444_12530 [Shewanella sp. MBTL60-112-B1]GIU34105.1 hypothetical protein TUM4445_22350 [Shewanella sp. MBTL60-112-B2]
MEAELFFEFFAFFLAIGSHYTRAKQIWNWANQFITDFITLLSEFVCFLAAQYAGAVSKMRFFVFMLKSTLRI